jgi:uncharacterized coiled-coil protein SlyX
MKYVVRNEKILGRNLIVLNKKIRAVEEKIALGETGIGGANGVQVQELGQRLDEVSQKMAELEARMQQLSESTASKEEVQEMHFVVDSINPLQFITLGQAKDLMAGKKIQPKEAKKEKK